MNNVTTRNFSEFDWDMFGGCTKFEDSYADSNEPIIREFRNVIIVGDRHGLFVQFLAGDVYHEFAINRSLTKENCWKVISSFPEDLEVDDMFECARIEGWQHVVQEAY